MERQAFTISLAQLRRLRGGVVLAQRDSSLEKDEVSAEKSPN